MHKYFVAIAGNIAVGKSSLTALLSRRLDWEPFYEAVAENPYLSDFYQDMPRYAFHSQVFFLSHRLRHHQRLLAHPGSVIQDRSIYEDAEIFERALHLQRHISERDHHTYRELYEAMIGFVPPPDLIVYLRASIPTLLHRVAQRGRPFEQTIEQEYLERLNQLYEEWLARFALCPILIIPADNLDFVHNGSDLDAIVAQIAGRLTESAETSAG